HMINDDIIWSCPSSLRLNTRGLPATIHMDKKAYTRGPSGPPSGPLTPGDVLDVSHADARHRLRSPPLAASHHSCGLTPPPAAARVAHETITPRAASRRGQSALRPWPASAAATAWRSPCHWSGQVQPEAPASSHAAGKNCDRRGRAPVVAARRPPPCTAW